MTWFMDPMPDGDTVRSVAQSLREAHGPYVSQTQQTQTTLDATMAAWQSHQSDRHTQSATKTQQAAQQHAEWINVLSDIFFVAGTLLKIVFYLQMAWVAYQAALIAGAIFTAGLDTLFGGAEGDAALTAALQAARQAVISALQGAARSLLSRVALTGATIGGASGFTVGVVTVNQNHESGWQAALTIFGDTTTGAFAGATVAMNPWAAAGTAVGAGQVLTDAAAGGPDGFQQDVSGFLGNIPLIGSTFAPPTDAQSAFDTITFDTFGADSASNLLPKRMPWDLRTGPDGAPVDGVDSTSFTSGKRTLNGGIRNARQYWQQLLKEHPEYFSPDNTAAINAGRAPKVDDQWLQSHGDQSYYFGQKLIHHHLDEGPTAVPLPQSFHGDKPWWGYWHAGMGGPDWVDPTTGDLGSYYKNLFRSAQRHGPFGGFFDPPPTSQPVGPGRTQ